MKILLICVNKVSRQNFWLLGEEMRKLRKNEELDWKLQGKSIQNLNWKVEFWKKFVVLVRKVDFWGKGAFFWQNGNFLQKMTILFKKSQFSSENDNFSKIVALHKISMVRKLQDFLKKLKYSENLHFF